MKKFALIAAVALTLGAASCNHADDSKMQTTYNVRTYSLVTDSKGNSTVSPTTYSFLMDMIDGTCTVGINNLIIDGVTASATTGVLPFVGANLVLGGADGNDNNNNSNNSNKWSAACYLIEAQNATAVGGRSITSFMGDITSASNTLNPILLNQLRDELSVNPILYPGGSAGNSIYSETQYDLEDYHVMTFWCDMLYTGSTVKMHPGTMVPVEDKNGVIRVYLNLEKASEYKATVYFYNFKNAAAEVGESDQEADLTVDFKLEDIPVTFNKNGFVIQGTNLVPVTLKDNKELPEFTMNDLLLTSSKNMTGIMCRFMLSDKTSFTFDGQGVYGYNIADFQ